MQENFLHKYECRKIPTHTLKVHLATDFHFLFRLEHVWFSSLQNEYLHQPLELVRVVQTCLYREAELVERQEQLNVCVMNSQ